MKKSFIGFFFILFIVEIIFLIVFSSYTPNNIQDAVIVNEIIQSIKIDFSDLDNHQNTTDLSYVVINNEEVVLYKTDNNLSEGINEAIRHQDTIVDIEIDGTIVAKVIIYNESANRFNTQKNIVIIVLTTVITLQFIISVAFVTYLYLSIIRPFKKLKSFAERVSNGNLDVPLVMDRNNLFGAFTESHAFRT